MRKLKLVMLMAGFLALVSSPAVYADGFAPGEGMYLGGFIGGGTGIVQPRVVTTQAATTGVTGPLNDPGGTFEAARGGVALEGWEGGGWVGYGYKMGDFYAGLEGEIAGGDVEFKLTSSVGVKVNPASDDAITEISAKKEWTGGMFGRLGVYINPSTLFSVKAGALVSKFDVTYGSHSEDFYGGGPAFGASLESTLGAIDPSLNLRAEAVYTDYMTASVSGIGGIAHQTTTALSDTGGHDSEVTGGALSARIGLTYSFFDAASLF